MNVVFRRLAEADLPLMHEWLNEPGVVRWWEGEDVSWEAIVRDYGPDNVEPTEHFIASIDGRDVGWIQCYALADHAEEDETQAHWRAGVDRGAGGIDYLVADPTARGQGVGSAMIRAFVHDVVFPTHPTWTQASAGPYLANTASWRALEKAGFRHLADYDDEDGDACRVMVIDRSKNRSR